jgi:hypothetical protein
MDKETKSKIKTTSEKTVSSLSFTIPYSNLSIYYHPLDDHSQVQTKKTTSFFTQKFSSQNDVYLY